VSRAYCLGELAQRLGGRVEGDSERSIRGVATLARADSDQISFLTNPRYRDRLATTRAAALLVAPDVATSGHDRLVVDEPYLALARLLELFYPAPARVAAISSRAHVAEDAQIGEDVVIEPFAVVESDCQIGDGVTLGAGCVVGRGSRLGPKSELRPRVVLYPDTQIGARCLIHAGVVLGADGFGFATSGSTHHKIPQLDRVVIEDDVEIGANTTVDRGMLDPTVVGQGSKIDNLVMLAHGVRLDAGSLLAAQVGIAGSTHVGKQARFAGQSGAAGHLELGDATIVAAKSAVLQDLPAGSFVAGIPAVDHRGWKRSQALIRRLPEMLKELRELRSRVAELEREREDS